MKKQQKKPNVFVVSWATYETDLGRMTSGAFRDPFKTRKAAKDAIRRDIEGVAKDCIGTYGEDEAKEIYGTSDPKRLAGEMVKFDSNDFFIVTNPDTDTETQYSIQGYCV